MAGIYRLEKGVPVFTILTRSPADSIAFIHNRMPVILGTVKYYAQIHLQVWQNFVCIGQVNLPLIAQ